MTKYRSALGWAIVIFGVALAGRFGVIDHAATTTLLIALPVAGWIAISGRGSCALRTGA